MIIKKCIMCGEEKFIDEFSKSKFFKDNHCIVCRSCYEKKINEFKHKHPVIFHNEEKYLKTLARKYDLNMESYYNLLASCKGCCSICGCYNKNIKTPKNIYGGSIKLCCDHDHKTGKIRGFLCWQCNMGLGFLENKYWNDDDNLETLGEAYNYLRKYKELEENGIKDETIITEIYN